MHLRSSHLSANAALLTASMLGSSNLFSNSANKLGFWNANQISLQISVPHYKTLFKHKKQTHYHGLQVPLGTSPCPSPIPLNAVTHYSSHRGLPVPPRPPVLSHLRLHTSWNALLHLLPYSSQGRLLCPLAA